MLHAQATTASAAGAQCTQNITVDTHCTGWPVLQLPVEPAMLMLCCKVTWLQLHIQSLRPDTHHNLHKNDRVRSCLGVLILDMPGCTVWQCWNSLLRFQDVQSNCNAFLTRMHGCAGCSVTTIYLDIRAV